MNVYFIVLYVLLIATIVFLAILLRRNEKALSAAEWRATSAEAEARDLDYQLATVLTKVAPLIEKTDWMTGRWGGKFDQLVAMENKRNNTIDIVRRALMNTPSVRKAVVQDGVLDKIGISL